MAVPCGSRSTAPSCSTSATSPAAPRPESIVRGNVFGIPVNTLFFAVIVVVLSGAQFKPSTGTSSPVPRTSSGRSRTPRCCLACVSLLILTIAVNLMANFVAPSFALAALLPRHLNFRRAAIVSAILGLIILPWNLYNSPVVIVYFLGGLGAFLGPLFGIVMADYWLLRKQRINVPELYTTDPEAPTSTAAGSTYGPSAPSSPPPRSRWCSPSSRP